MSFKIYAGLVKQILLTVFLFLTISAAHAFTPEKSAEKTVEESVVIILDLIRALSSETTTDQYLIEMEKLMDELVSYPVIARRVMGSHFSSATREQKIKFLAALKTSLINTYALGIKSFGGYRVAVQYGKGEQNTLKNTQVFLEIQSPEGNRYPMMQSMYYSRNSNGWLVQNIVFNGVNLGITFKNQFERVMELANGDLDEAIVLWKEITQDSYDQTNYREPSETLLKESAEGDSF